MNPKEISPIEKIDNELKHFYKLKDKEDVYVDHKNIQTNLEAFYERKAIIRKLVKDGYLDSVMKVRVMGDSPVKHYRISFEGQVFIQNGSYKQKQINEEYRLARQESDRKVSKRNEMILAYGSVTLALVEIAKLLIEHHRWISFFCNLKRFL